MYIYCKNKQKSCLIKFIMCLHLFKYYDNIIFRETCRLFHKAYILSYIFDIYMVIYLYTDYICIRGCCLKNSAGYKNSNGG